MENEPEFEFAVRLADKVLDMPSRDPDDDLSVLARQFLRSVEREIKLRQKLLFLGYGN